MPDDPPNSLPIAPGVAVPLNLLDFTFARSGGPGGQNVNKLNTKATLSVRLDDLVPYLSFPVIHRLVGLAGSRVTDDGRLLIHCEESRSQQANKAECLAKLRELLVQARHIPKRRRKTKPTKGSKQRRLQGKKLRGEIKQSRRQPPE